MRACGDPQTGAALAALAAPDVELDITSFPNTNQRCGVVCTILVVDDHPVTREPLARLLQFEGFRTACAANGVEALAAVAQSRPDLILLDVMMPKMNGVDFLEHLRRDPDGASIPVIGLTGVFDPNHLARLRELGVADVLTKARFTVEQLLECVRRHVPSAGAACVPA
jgi:CheY-like chemotaxis protein